MSENTNSVNQDGSFDVFDLGGSTPVADPFAGVGNTQPQLDVVKTPAPAQTEQTAEEKNETASDEAEPKQQADDNQAEQASTNPLVAGAAKAEEKQAVVTAESLFAKAPVFEYGGASEDITDASKTFEELRIEKASDFPELEDGKRVSWSMEYGKIVKSVATPNKTTIGKMKSEIENSKEFIEALKKAKDKNLVCKVKPKITAQSKGIASYNIQANVVTADFVHCRKIAANKLFVRFECWANDCMAVSDFIGAGYVSTGNLSVSLSDIQAVDADKIITLPQKRRGLLGLLWASWWKSLFMSLFYGGIEEQEDDAEPENVQAASAADSAEDKPANETAPNQYVVMSEMVGSILDSLRQNGYQISKIETPDNGTKNAAA